MLHCRIKIIVNTYGLWDKNAIQFQWELDLMGTGLTVDCFQPSTLETTSCSDLSEGEWLL